MGESNWTGIKSTMQVFTCKLKKGKVFPYSLRSVGTGADPGEQAVSQQVTLSHTPGGRLPLLSVSPAVTFPAKERHRPSAGTKLYCLVIEAHGCEQLAQGCSYPATPRPGTELTTSESQVERSNHYTTKAPQQLDLRWY